MREEGGEEAQDIFSEGMVVLQRLADIKPADCSGWVNLECFLNIRYSIKMEYKLVTHMGKPLSFSLMLPGQFLYSHAEYSAKYM